MKKQLFIVEACEYNKQFLSLDVDYAAITNVELDHADVYGTLENYMETFQDFSASVSKKIFILEDTLGKKDYVNSLPLDLWSEK